MARRQWITWWFAPPIQRGCRSAASLVSETSGTIAVFSRCRAPIPICGPVWWWKLMPLLRYVLFTSATLLGLLFLADLVFSGNADRRRPRRHRPRNHPHSLAAQVAGGDTDGYEHPARHHLAAPHCFHHRHGSGGRSATCDCRAGRYAAINSAEGARAKPRGTPDPPGTRNPREAGDLHNAASATRAIARRTRRLALSQLVSPARYLGQGSPEGCVRRFRCPDVCGRI